MTSATDTLCFLAWQLIKTIRFLYFYVPPFVEKLGGQLSIALQPFDFSGVLFAAGCLALWPEGQAALRKTSVTCSQRWTPSSQPWPSSTLSTKSCWDRSYGDEREDELKKNNLWTIGDVGEISMRFYDIFSKNCLFVTTLSLTFVQVASLCSAVRETSSDRSLL